MKKIVNSKYVLLNDRQWLYQKYIVEKIGTKGICKLVGAKTPNSVRQALIKFDIPVRSVSDGVTCNREDDGMRFDKEAMDVVIGSLLGDATMFIWNEDSEHSYPYFKKCNIGYDHIVFVAKKMFGDKWEKLVDEEYKGGNLGDGHCFSVRSLVHKELKPIYHEWYTNGKKVVPKNIEITPTVLLHWFMDDGSTWQRRKESKIKQVCIVFCSESFTKDDQLWLCKEMNENYDLKATIHKCPWGTGWRIFIAQSRTKKFFDLIGDCPVPSMQYKWKV